MGLFTVVVAVRTVAHIKHESNIMAIGFPLTAVSPLSLKHFALRQKNIRWLYMV